MKPIGKSGLRSRLLRAIKALKCEAPDPHTNDCSGYCANYSSVVCLRCDKCWNAKQKKDPAK